jgi:hypothetical protein
MVKTSDPEHQWMYGRSKYSCYVYHQLDFWGFNVKKLHTIKETHDPITKTVTYEQEDTKS